MKKIEKNIRRAAVLAGFSFIGFGICGVGASNDLQDAKMASAANYLDADLETGETVPSPSDNVVADWHQAAKSATAAGLGAVILIGGVQLGRKSEELAF